MRGLILKDLFILKQNYKTFFVLIIFFILAMFQNSSAASFTSVINAVFTMMITTTISYDNLAKWDKYALTMPITRKEMVLSKYICSIIFNLIGLVLGIVIVFAMGIVRNNLNITEIFISAISSAIVMIIFISLMFPLVYKFGVEKFRIFLILIFMIPVFFILALRNMTNVGKLIDKWLIYIIISVPVIAVIGFVLSYFISIKIYENKEF